METLRFMGTAVAEEILSWEILGQQPRPREGRYGGRFWRPGDGAQRSNHVFHTLQRYTHTTDTTVYVHGFFFVCMYTCTYVHIYVCIYLRTYMCMYLRPYIHVYRYVYTEV